MTKPDFTIAILAGGAGRRLDGNKPGRIIAGRPLIEHILARLKAQGPILLNGAPELARAYALPFVADAKPERAGPLAGLLAALRWARNQGLASIITVPCDTPFLPEDLVTRLRAAPGEVALAQGGGHVHPTIGRWPVSLIDRLSAAHEGRGMNRMKDFIEELDVVRVIWPDVPIDPFFNVNTPFELAQAEYIISGANKMPLFLDLQGLKCPIPALKVAKALDTLPPGKALIAACTDPLAAVDIPHLVQQRGDELLASELGGKVLRFFIRLKGE